MKKLRILIICIILVLIIIGVIATIKIIEINEQETILVEENMGIEELPEDIIEQLDYSEWLQVKKSINQYLNTINKNSGAYYGRDENNNYVKVIEETEIKKKIYSLLSQNYINENEINIENVYNYIDNVTKNQIYTILSLKKIVNSKYNHYIVQGVIEEENKLKSVKNFIVNFNLEETTFSIEPIKGNVDINSIEAKEVEIIKNDYNKIPTVLANTENIIKEYFNMAKRLILIYPEKAYEYLDEEYRNAKFESIAEFQEYIDNNREKYSTMRIEKYQETVTDDYTQYVCVDQNENYYIFRENAVLDYSLILDTYTLDLPEFTEKYDIATNQNKVVMNIQKIFEAINDGDYNYAYKKLDTTFKQKNFQNEKAFEDYTKQNFINNKLEYGNCEQNGELYICDITITNETGKSSKKKFVMKLLEGTNFVYSFNS